MIQDDSLFFYLFQMGTKEPITCTHESRGRGYVKPVCKQFLPQPSSHTPGPLVPISTPIRFARPPPSTDAEPILRFAAKLEKLR